MVDHFAGYGTGEQGDQIGDDKLAGAVHTVSFAPGRLLIMRNAQARRWNPKSPKASTHRDSGKNVKYGKNATSIFTFYWLKN
ncbi:hypothetical protein ACFPOU_16370 [Massilia jejuensis]|uniref:Uncharacterized protein n=1 Tax=Massilia jejuensis TaxID=648894 RepID=A0ABW0PJW1_9BURK